MPSINVLLSVAVPPLTNNPSVSPTCCVPGKVFIAAVISALALAVVTMSMGFNTVVLF
ncbi:MAG: hypothetical protein WKF59_03865 [Chitinophagaceae bacterium]